SEEVLNRKFTFVLDLHEGTWKAAKALLKTLQEVVPDKIHQIVIIKPDAFWEKRKSD
ncbi:predicted protein, partial [Nematostella vectensis]